MIVVRREKEPNSLLQFRKQYPDADYETDRPTNVLKDKESRCGRSKGICVHIV